MRKKYEKSEKNEKFISVPSAAFSTQFQPMQFDAPQLQTTGSFVGFPNGGQPNFVFYPEFKNESESEDTTLKAGGLKTRDATVDMAVIQAHFCPKCVDF